MHGEKNSNAYNSILSKSESCPGVKGSNSFEEFEEMVVMKLGGNTILVPEVNFSAISMVSLVWSNDSSGSPARYFPGAQCPVNSLFLNCAPGRL